MIRLTFTVDNIDTVMLVYNQIQIRRASSEIGPFVDVVGLGPIILDGGLSIYTLNDAVGVSTDWYVSRYYSTTTGYSSEWSSPVLGEIGDIFYNPLYPSEINYGTSQKLVIDRIRRLIGDPVRLRREYGENASVYMHNDGKTFELPEIGWPASVIMDGIAYVDMSNPSVNDYKYLRFTNYIGNIFDAPIDSTYDYTQYIEEFITTSGTDSIVSRTINSGIDVWYYTFRHSDRQIMEAYNSCPAPYPLTEFTATSEVYMLQTAIDMVRKELIESSVEDGAMVRDEGTIYNPEAGLKIRKLILDDLQTKLDKLVKALSMSGITGVLID